MSVNTYTEIDHLGSRNEPLYPLLLIGGQSSRMGTRKELLKFPDGKTAFERAIELLHAACPTAPTIYISISDRSQLEAIRPLMEKFTTQPDKNHPIHIPNIEPLLDTDHNIGPAAGLMSAYYRHPSGRWLILGCDYPLLPLEALQCLIRQYRNPSTGLGAPDCSPEPFIAIWNSKALEVLKGRVMEGRTSPRDVLMGVSRIALRARERWWVLGTNTRGEWEEAMRIWSGLEGRAVGDVGNLEIEELDD